MKQHYPFTFFCLLLLGLAPAQSQEPEQFERSDFQLRGPVEQCVVKAAYGEERFEFDQEGRLLKSLTQFSPEDYDITYYRFRDGVLFERRDEVYREGAFDPRTSIAHIYERDSASGPIKGETILSYDRSIQERVAYRYGPDGRLVQMVRDTEGGVDDIQVTYETYRGEETTSYIRNGQIQRSVRTSQSQFGGKPVQVVLTKEYSDGVPQKAVEETRDAQNRLLREVTFIWDAEKDSFQPEQTRTIAYDAASFPVREEIASGKEGVRKRTYIYQMDGADPANWVRQVVSPENSMVVRRIIYFTPGVEPTPSDSLTP